MISNTYIHGNDLQEGYIFESIHLMNAIEDETQRFYALEEELTEANMFNESVDDLLPYFEAEKTNIFERIGQAIINMMNAFVKAITDICNKVKSNVLKSNKELKTDGMKKAMQENPELAKEFLKSVSSGNIKVNDVKDFDELVDEANRLIKDYENGKLDKQSFSDKFDSAVNRFNKKSKPVGEILKTAGAALGLISTVTAIHSNIVKSTTDSQEKAIKSAKFMEDTVNSLKKKCSKGIEQNGEEITKMQFMARKVSTMNAAVGKSCSMNAKLSEKVTGFLADMSAKHNLGGISRKLTADDKLLQKSNRANNAFVQWNRSTQRINNSSGNNNQKTK